MVEPAHQTRSRIYSLSSCKLEHKGPGTCYPHCRASVSIHPAHQGLCTAGADDTWLIATATPATGLKVTGRTQAGFLHGSPVCWRPARQAFVTLSTAESELVAGLDAVVALQSAKAMLSDF